MTKKELEKYRRGHSLYCDIQIIQRNIKVVEGFIKEDIAHELDLPTETYEFSRRKIYIANTLMDFIDSKSFRLLLNFILEGQQKRLKELKEELKKL